MDIGVNATKILNRLELFDVFLIVALLAGARLASFLLRWVIRHLAESAPLRWRLAILKLMPMARLLVVGAAVAIIVPIVIQPTFQNVVTLVAAVGLALAFALKDFASSLIAGLVTVVEGLYQPGDWIEVDGAYGEVTVVGLRALRLVTLDDTEVIIPTRSTTPPRCGGAWKPWRPRARIAGRRARSTSSSRSWSCRSLSRALPGRQGCSVLASRP